MSPGPSEPSNQPTTRRLVCGFSTYDRQRSCIHLALALVGAFLFARWLALSRPAALLVAVRFGLGLPYMVWLEHPMSGAVVWLPWLLLCVERMVSADVTGRGHLGWVLGVTAFPHLGGGLRAGDIVRVYAARHSSATAARGTTETTRSKR